MDGCIIRKVEILLCNGRLRRHIAIHFSLGAAVRSLLRVMSMAFSTHQMFIYMPFKGLSREVVPYIAETMFYF